MTFSWWTMFSASMAVYLGIATGTLVRRIGWLSEEADQSMTRLTVSLLYPCLIFANVSSNPLLRKPENLVWPPLLGFGTIAGGLVVALLAARLGPWITGLHNERQRRTFAVGVGIYNYGYLPTPLVQILFGGTTLGMLFVYNLGCDVALWTLGVMLMRGELGRRWWRQLITGPTLAIALALLANFTGAAGCLPGCVNLVIAWFGQSAIPLSLVLIGAIVADELRPSRHVQKPADQVKTVLWTVLLRAGLLPLGMLLLARLVPGSPDLKRVVAVQAAMPCGTFFILMARHYGGDPPVALRVAIASSLASLVTIAPWIAFGMRLLMPG